MRRYSRLCPVSMALFMALWLAGCGGGSSPSVANIPGADGRTLPAQDTVPNFNVTVATDQASYTVGQAINISVSATNSDSNPHTLTYPSPDAILRWGYIITRGNTIVAYEYWTGHKLAFTNVVTADIYEAGATKTFSYVFPYNPSGATAAPVTSLPAGTYQIYAMQADLTYDGSTAIRHTIPTPASNPALITVR